MTILRADQYPASNWQMCGDGEACQRLARLCERKFLSGFWFHTVKPRRSSRCLQGVVQQWAVKAGVHHAEIPALHYPYMDHVSVWNLKAADGQKDFAIVSQPYIMNGEDLEALAALSRKLKLICLVSGDSWHFPGVASLVIIWRKEFQEVLAAEHRRETP